MFAYVLRAPNSPADDQGDEFFRRFAQTPGLKHAFVLEGVEDSEDQFLVAVWEDREDAERYLSTAPLRKEVDQAMSPVTRTMYEVRNSK